METRPCGKSNLTLSALGLGCWAFGGGEYWGESDQNNVTQLVHRAVDLGITYFDTAEVYNEGRSEEFLGRALQKIQRDRVLIGSKISPTNLYPDVLTAHCEASLKRLGTDYLDLYMIHWPLHPYSLRHFTTDEAVLNNPPSLPDAVQTLQKLQDQGKIRFVGISNFGRERLEEIQKIGGQYAVNQLAYSLLTRAAEMDILPYCQESGVGVIAYMALMQGLLSDKYASFDEIPDWHKRTRHFNCRRTSLCRHGEEGAEAETMQALAEIREIARECGMSVAELALKWVISDERISCALVGTQNIGRLESNIASLEKPFPAEVQARLTTATDALKATLGPALDVFEGAEHDRTR